MRAASQVALGIACASHVAMSTKPLAHQVMPGAGDAESAAAAEGAVRTRDSLFHWCGTADAIRQSRPDEKAPLLDAYFAAVGEETVAAAARYFAGRFFPEQDASTPAVARGVIADSIRELTRCEIDDVERGDLAGFAAMAFAGRLPSGVAISEIAEWGEELARASGSDREEALVTEMLARVSSLEAQYLVALLTSTLGALAEAASIAAAVARRPAASGTDSPRDRRQPQTTRSTITGPARRRRRRAP